MGTSCCATTGTTRPECAACASDISDLKRWARCVDRMICDLDSAADHHLAAQAYALGAMRVLRELSTVSEAPAERRMASPGSAR